MLRRSEDKDQQLVSDFRMGSQKAFARLFRQLYPATCFYALRYTCDQCAAEDIAEESFIKVWDRREMFFDYRVLRSFLYSTVRNACLNWLKQRDRQMKRQKEIEFNSSIIEVCVLENIVRAEVFRDIHTALEKLPPKCREIISLIFFQEKSVRDVADELNLSIETVKAQKRRGLILLRNKLLSLVLLQALLNFFWF